MSQFFPALASTDCIGFFDDDEVRGLLSIRALMPPKMSSRFLTSLSFDEDIHYSITEEMGDKMSKHSIQIPQINTVFVDCGAFHYKDLDSPKFRMGGFVSAKTAFREYKRRHMSRSPRIEFLLCSPDHIIPPDASDEVFRNRTEFTLISAKSFLELCEGEDVVPIGVVHGRDMEERSEMTKALIELGYQYIAFGGLVPISRKQHEVLRQLTGIGPLDLWNCKISPDSPLGIAKNAGVRTHLFGLNSPDWYRWAKRLGVDSFDGSKLSQEGAKNGIIWLENDSGDDHELTSANEMYRRLYVKGLKFRMIKKSDEIARFEFKGEDVTIPDSTGWKYLSSSRCTSPNCPHGPEAHICDPRVFGSIEHNMGRTIINSWVFESIMERIDDLVEEAKTSENENLQRNWSPIGVG